MAPLIKDTLELTNSAAEAALSKASAPIKPEPAGGHLRADALSLEIPVKVHGSRVTEIVRETTQHTEPFEEQTSSMIVFPQGGVLRMSTPVIAGQMLVVTNLKSRQDAICRVVKVRTFSNLQGYVEVEFTNKQPGYWGVYFPSDGPSIANKIVPSVPTVAPEPGAKESPAASVSSMSDISWAPSVPSSSAQRPLDANSFSTSTKQPASMPAKFIPQAKPEPSFVSIGSQEDVQPAASATVTTKPGVSTSGRSHVQIPKLKTVTEHSKPMEIVNFSPPPSVILPSSLSMSELRGDASAKSSSVVVNSPDAPVTEELHVSDKSSATSPRKAFGTFAGGATLDASRASSPELSGAQLESGSAMLVGQVAPPRRNWILVAACCFMILGGLAAAGFFYFRSAANGGASSPAQSVISQPAASISTSAQPAANVVPSQSSGTSSASTLSPAPSSPAASNGNARVASNGPATGSVRPGIIVKQAAPSVTSEMMDATVASHPVVSQRSDGAGVGEAPSVDGQALPSSENSGLSKVISSENVASPPLPEIKSENPEKVGGEVKQPHLIFSTPPIYPRLAKESNVHGNVVIKATIDPNGRVVHMEAVSGPAILRQAAIDALRLWKYEPTKLDGQAVAVQTLVTIQFRQ